MNDDMQMGEAMRLKAELERDILRLVKEFQSLTGLGMPAVTLEHSREATGLFTRKVSGVNVHVEF